MSFWTLACLVATAALADSERAPAPLLSVSRDGSILFRMMPESAGRGTAYRLSPTGELLELWRTEGWYAFEVFLADDGIHLVRMGPWCEGSTPSKDDLAVAFYREGKLLKQYSTAELVQDHSKVGRTASHYDWLASADQKIFRNFDIQRKLDWNSYFKLTTIDGVRYTFDLATGEVIQKENVRDESTGWPSIDEIDRLCIAVPLVKFPFPYSELNEIIGVPRGARFRAEGSAGKLAYPTLLLSDPAPNRGYYALRLTVRADDPIYFETKKLPASVEALSLVFVTAEGHVFQFVPTRSLRELIDRLRKELEQSGGTPRILSEKAYKGLNGRLIFEH